MLRFYPDGSTYWGLTLAGHVRPQPGEGSPGWAYVPVDEPLKVPHQLRKLILLDTEKEVKLRLRNELHDLLGSVPDYLKEPEFSGT